MAEIHDSSTWRKLGSIPYYLQPLPPQLHLRTLNPIPGTRYLHAVCPSGGPTYTLPLPLYSPTWSTEIITPYGKYQYPSKELLEDHPNQVWAAVRSFGCMGKGFVSVVHDNGLVCAINCKTGSTISTNAWSVKAGSLRVAECEFYCNDEGVFGVVVGRNDERYVDVRVCRKEVEGEGRDNVTTLPRPVVGGDLGGGEWSFTLTPSSPKITTSCINGKCKIARFTMHPTLTVVTCLTDGTVFTDGGEVKLGFTIDDMSWSHNGKYVSFLSDDIVVVMDHKLTSVVTKFTLTSGSNRGRVGWLGSDCVAVWSSNGDVTLIGPYGDECKWKIGKVVNEGGDEVQRPIKNYCLEVDGARWVDDSGGLWWVGRVPEVIEDIYNPGSVSTAACLVNGTAGNVGERGMDKNTHRIIMDAMLCVSGKERTRLARLGKGGGKEGWASMKLARVLESAWKRGVYITSKQATDIASTLLLHSPLFGYHAASLLSHPVGDSVTVIIQLKMDEMISNGVKGNELVHRVLEIVKGYEGSKGWKSEGVRGKIAVWLKSKGLEEEGKAIAKLEPEIMFLIPVLLEMGLYKLAAQRAGGDTELLGMCLWEVERKMNREEFCNEVKGWGREGVGLVKKYWREQGRTRDLVGFLIALGQPVMAVDAVVGMGEVEGKEEKIKEGLRILGTQKGNDFQKAVLTEELELRAWRREMRQQFKGVEFGNSVISLINGLITYASLDPREGTTAFKAITDTAKKFKITEPKLIKVKARMFAKLGMWGNFRNLQQNCPKNMLDSDVFVRCAIESNAPKVEVARYITGVRDGYRRFKLWAEIGDMEQARKEAAGKREWLAEIGA